VTPRLLGFVDIPHRFARSTNVERDSDRVDLGGYVLTSRALDVIERVINAIRTPSAGRALSLTGPYGTGKSSLALFIDALLGNPSHPVTKASHALLAEASQPLAAKAASALALVGSNGDGFIRAVVTAQREPVLATLIRALVCGVRRYCDRHPHVTDEPVLQRVLSLGAAEQLTVAELRHLVMRVCEVAPVLIVIDEFGKCLEYALRAPDSTSADLFVLQDLAEWAAGATAMPAVIITLQHLAVQDYSAHVSSLVRREWSKVLGRFVDIPFVEEPAQAQALIRAVLTPRNGADRYLLSWAKSMRTSAVQGGFASSIHGDAGSCFPLHPVVLSTLPDLCARYGQHERTLFSFLAGAEPFGVRAFLDAPTPVDPARATVRLHHVYDYFVDAAATLIGASPASSRWLEIETRIRDANGLSAAERRVIKAIGVLNLVAAGGTLRASLAVLITSCADTLPGTKDSQEVGSVLESLSAKGLITYRDFADEFRIWHGSDFDLGGAVERAHQRLKAESVAAILMRVKAPAPIVAARHSQETGTLRIFERRFIDRATPQPLTNLFGSQTSGIVLLALDDAEFPELPASAASKPIVVGRLTNATQLVTAALVFASHLEVLNTVDGVESDWVARRELRERVSVAMQQLDHAIEQSFGSTSPSVTWYDISQGRRQIEARNLSGVLSDLCDKHYWSAPILRNEMIARNDLTSQGAKARNDLLEAMVQSGSKHRLGLEGFGPECAIYEALLSSSGIHREHGGLWNFGAPSDPDPMQFAPAWHAMIEELNKAAKEALPVSNMVSLLQAPPFGLKAGPIPILITAVLISESDDVALYEEGTFITHLTAEVIERLAKNPTRFRVKRYSSRGPRAVAIDALSESLGATRRSGRGRVSSVVSVVAPLFSRVRGLSPYARSTKRISGPAQKVRRALLEAREPDNLIFQALPDALGLPIFSDTSTADVTSLHIEAQRYVDVLSHALAEIENVDRVLLGDIERAVALAISEDPQNGEQARTNLGRRAALLVESVRDPKLRALVMALQDTQLDHSEWLAYVGMVTANKPCMNWTDDDASRFEQNLYELAGAFRRLEALHHEQADERHGTHEAVRLTLTRQDGTDIPRLVWMDPELHNQIDHLVDQTLTSVSKAVGSKGTEMFLVSLVKRILDDQTHIKTPSQFNGGTETSG